jgi:outer membrane biosynthesis protein TonB
MNKIALSLLFTLTIVITPTSILGAELNQVDYSGMQLAWVSLPRSSSSEVDTDSSKVKPKPKAIQEPPPAVKPLQEPVPKPIGAPATKPVEVPVVKPVQLPAAKPLPAPDVKPTPTLIPRPVVAPVAKPAQVVDKPVQQPSYKESPRTEWIVGIGLDLGGETLGTVVYTDGTSAPVKANNGVYVNVGAILANGKNSSFSTQMTVGYKYGGPKGIGGDVTWSAIPLEVIEYYRTSKLRMGLGLAYHLSPQLSVILPASTTAYKYNNAIGIVAQIGWAPVNEHYSIDLRYTSIKFQSSDVPGASAVDGSVAGLYTSYQF